jgi:hypothetical protein
MAYKPNSVEIQGGIEHIVYEYSNLVFGGEHTLKAPGAPIDVLAQNAFLMVCRELYEFFGRRSKKPDIRAIHYCNAVPFRKPSLRKWKAWKKAIDRQVAHLSYGRVTDAKRWIGHDGTNAALLEEFRTAFLEFLKHVDARYRPEFDRRLAERSNGLGLPLP